MGYSEKKTDWLGNEYIQHYDDHGNRICTSEEKTDWFGNEYVQHYDEERNRTGTSEEKTGWFGNEYVQHYDEARNRTGTSEEKTGWFGNEYVQHHDEERNRTGTSEKKTDWLGNEYVRHRDEPGKKRNTGGTYPDKGVRGYSGGGAAGCAAGAPAAGAAAGGSPVALAILTAGVIAAAAVLRAGCSFLARYETAMMILLVLGIPGLILGVTAHQVSSGEEELMSAGMKQAICSALVSGLSCLLCVFFSGRLSEPLQNLADLAGESSWLLGLILMLIHPVVLFLFVFLPFLLLGLGFRTITAGVPEEHRSSLAELNQKRLTFVCRTTALAEFVIFFGIGMEKLGLGMFIFGILFWGGGAYLAVRIMISLSRRIMNAENAA